MNSKVLTISSQDDTISKYFKDIRKNELLTPEQEVELAKRIKKGDNSAIETLVKANLKFVVSVAKDYQGQGITLSDLISEGNLGLVKAATRFDHTRGFRFISYAVWWIKESILKSLNDNSRVIRLPTNVIKRLQEIRKEINAFELSNERNPGYCELLDDNGEFIDFNDTPSCMSLNESINDDGDELYSILEDTESSETDVHYLIDNRVKDEIERVLSVLSEREKEIIECYFGINKDYNGMTLDVIGEKHNLTKERIRQIKNKALRKLRHNSSDLFDILNK